LLILFQNFISNLIPRFIFIGMQSIKVFAPATVANVACGFDVLGFALQEPGDEVIMRLADHKQVLIKEITGDEGKLSLQTEKNTVSVTVQKYLNFLGISQGVDIWLHKKMPLGSGLGSSAASAVAGLVAINELLGKPNPSKELLRWAMEGERVACGSAHADNVAPSLLGGFVLIRSYEPLDVHKLPFPTDLVAAVIHPHIELRTEVARSVLPKEIKIATAVKQWGNVGGLVAGLCLSNFELISNSLQDVVAEPARAGLIPYFYAMQNAALDSGALGCSISGAGPSVFALCKGREIAEKVAKSMTNILKNKQIGFDTYISTINKAGAKIMD
jgi:homoserine kinase